MAGGPYREAGQLRETGVCLVPHLPLSYVAFYLKTVKIRGMNEMAIDNWLNCKEAAEKIGCTADHVRLLLRKAQIAGRQLNDRYWLVDSESIERFLKKPKTRGRPRKNSK